MGDSSDHHQPEEFRKISEIKKLSQRERKALAALDAPGAIPSGQTAGQSVEGWPPLLTSNNH